MRRARFGTLVVVAMAIGMFAAIPLAYGGEVGNQITIEKVVDGPAPAGTVFSVQVSCEESALETVFFDEAGQAILENGDPIPSNVVFVEPSDVCTVAETVDGDATSVGYECAPDSEAVRTECIEANVVEFVDVVNSGATVTVTNTFEAPPTPTPPAPLTTPAPVVAPARFTG
jgi:hypothetical protein